MHLPSLYSKTGKGKLNIWTIYTNGDHIITEWGEAGGKTQKNSVVIKGKNVGRSNETAPGEQADKEAQSKWEAKKLKKYYESPEEAMSTLNIKPMLAYTLDDKRRAKLQFPVDMQPKFNGVRCMAYLWSERPAYMSEVAYNMPGGSVRLMSRGGKDYTVPAVQVALEGLLAPGTCLDGELYIHGESLQSIRHLMAEEDPRITFHVYDYTALPADSTPWVERLGALESWYGGHVMAYCIEEVDTVTVWNTAEIDRVHNDYVEQGYEGAMIRLHDKPYKLAGKSTGLLKVKDFVDAEFRIISWSTGRDGVVRYKCIQEEGLEFEVRPIGNVETRKLLLQGANDAIGQLLTVKYQERSDDNIPIFPVGISIRPPEDL